MAGREDRGSAVHSGRILTARRAHLGRADALLGDVHPLPIGTVLLKSGGYALTAFHEEALYRGVFLQRLRPKGIWTAVLVSSPLFGLAHLSNNFVRWSGNPAMGAFSGFGTVLIAVGFAALRLRTESL